MSKKIREQDNLGFLREQICRETGFMSALLTEWPVSFLSVFKIFLNKQPNPKKKLLVPCALDPPNPNCYVCASKPEVTVRLNVHKVTVLTLQDKVNLEY